MKRTLRAMAVAAAAMAGSGAFAAGAYDGIYNVPNSPLYISVHQNGNHVIAGQFYTVPTQDLGVSGPGIPSNINLWDVFGGDIAGNTVVVSGSAILNSCNISYRIEFDATGAYMKLIAASNTAFGNQIGMNCGALASGSQTVRVNRVF